MKLVDYPGYANNMEKLGYNAEQFELMLTVYSDANQVITINDTVNQRTLSFPLEENVLEWSGIRLAEMIAEAITTANNG